MKKLEKLIACAGGREPADCRLTGAKVFDVFTGQFYEEDLYLAGGVILGRAPRPARKTLDLSGLYLLPGFIEAHVHLESSYLNPQEFARLLISRGTTTAVCDPHEIANVLGLEGLEYLLCEGKKTPLSLYFMVPSCVPAAPFGTPGAVLSAEEVGALLKRRAFLGLGEVMNFPGVIEAEKEVLEKLKATRLFEKIIDGHAPLLSGQELEAYRLAGPASEHEAVSLKEAEEKLRAGFHILIRRGTVANNLRALAPLIRPETFPFISLVSDDVSAEELLKNGHLDRTLREAVALGVPPETAIRLVTITPARYFGLRDRGGIFPGARADLVAVTDLKTFTVKLVLAGGEVVARDGEAVFPKRPPSSPPPHPVLIPEELDFSVPKAPGKIRVIGIRPGEIITEHLLLEPKIEKDCVVADPERDLLKIVCLERHHGTGRLAVGFVKGFGLKEGALGSTVAHDSHQMLLVGVNDEDLKRAAWRLKALGGGLVVVNRGEVLAELPLPVGGLLAELPAEEVAQRLAALKEAACRLGGVLPDPFMTLSFLALPVIPALKITDQGLVDVNRFELVPLFSEV